MHIHATLLYNTRIQDQVYLKFRARHLRQIQFKTQLYRLSIVLHCIKTAARCVAVLTQVLGHQLHTLCQNCQNWAKSGQQAASM